MELLQSYHYIASAFIARLFLGCLFFFQGYDAIFGIGIKNVTATFENNFAGKSLPRFLIVAAAWYTSWTELVGGILLLCGLFTYPALYLLGINLLIAAIGFGIRNPLWDTRYVLPRLILLLLLLAMPDSWHLLSADHFLFGIK